MASPAQHIALDIGATGVLNLTNGRAEVTKFFFTNFTGVQAYVQLFDQAASTVVWGTTQPIQPFTVPVNATLVVDLTSHPWLFDNQCSIAASTHPIFTGALSTGLLVNALIN